MNSEAPTEAEALYAASKLIALPWFRGLVFLADRINDHAICEIEEANIDITLDEFGNNRGDTVQYSRVHGYAYIDGTRVHYTAGRKRLTGVENHAQN